MGHVFTARAGLESASAQGSLRNGTAPPLVPEVGIIGLVPNDWYAPWMPRHHLLARLSRCFPVIWMNPAPGWRELFHSRPAPLPEGPPPPAHLTVYDAPPWLPRLHAPEWAAERSFRGRLRDAARRLTRQGATRHILYLWRPDFAQALGLVPHELSCYHIDDEYTFADEEQPIEPNEQRLIQSVDQVFIHSPALLDKKAHLNSHTTQVPNGVDYRLWSAPMREPRDLAAIPHPRIGFVGRLKKVLDWPLLLALAERHPTWQFVFVGPRAPHSDIRGPLEILSELPNAHFLPARPPDELPAYAQHFDVCIMPYLRNGYTKFIYPMKLHEYLATGRPVVGTPIQTLQAFAHVVRLAETPDQWSWALRQALDEGGRGGAARRLRQQVAREHDWHRLANHVAAMLAVRLGPDVAERLALADKRRRDERLGERRRGERRVAISA